MVNDISIISGIIIFFIAVGVALPFVNDAFGEASSSVNIDAFSEEIGNKSSGLSDTTIEPTWTNPVGSLNAVSVLASVLSMFFWTFGAIPFWIDVLVFLPLRMILVLIIARNIWIGGGG